MMSTPVSRRSSSSVSSSRASPPLKRNGKISWNFSLTLSKAVRKRSRVVLLMVLIVAYRESTAFFRSSCCSSRNVSLFFRLLAFRNGRQIHFTHLIHFIADFCYYLIIRRSLRTCHGPGINVISFQDFLDNALQCLFETHRLHFQAVDTLLEFSDSLGCYGGLSNT